MILHVFFCQETLPAKKPLDSGENYYPVVKSPEMAQIISGIFSIECCREKALTIHANSSTYLDYTFNLPVNCTGTLTRLRTRPDALSGSTCLERLAASASTTFASASKPLRPRTHPPPRLHPRPPRRSASRPPPRAHPSPA